MKTIDFIENMQLGISTACMFPLNTEEALSKLLNMGYGKFEVFFNSDCELAKNFVNKLKERIRHYGASVVAVHPYTSELESSLFFSQYERRFFDGIEYYKKYFEAASLLGAKYVVLHGPNKLNRMGSAFIAHRLNLIQEYAMREGVEILLENVSRSYINTPERFSEIIQHGVQCGFVLDFKQASRLGYGIDEYLSVMGAYLKHIHASDQNKHGNCLAIGLGDLDFAYIIKMLHDVGYMGSCVMEVYSKDTEESAFMDSKRIYDYILNTKVFL